MKSNDKYVKKLSDINAPSKAHSSIRGSKKSDFEQILMFRKAVAI